VEILIDNVFRPIMAPATGGFFSAILVFCRCAAHDGSRNFVKAVANDVPLNLMQPAELLALSDNPGNWAPEQHDTELFASARFARGRNRGSARPDDGLSKFLPDQTAGTCASLNQMLLFSRFRPMMSFGRPAAGGHVVLSFQRGSRRG